MGNWIDVKDRLSPEFSKTDLSEIHRCLKYMTKGGVTPYSCHTVSLAKKVKDMINNYSETATPKKDVT